MIAGTCTAMASALEAFAKAAEQFAEFATAMEQEIHKAHTDRHTFPIFIEPFEFRNVHTADDLFLYFEPLIWEAWEPVPTNSQVPGGAKPILEPG